MYVIIYNLKKSFIQRSNPICFSTGEKIEHTVIVIQIATDLYMCVNYICVCFVFYVFNPEKGLQVYQCAMKTT